MDSHIRPAGRSADDVAREARGLAKVLRLLSYASELEGASGLYEGAQLTRAAEQLEGITRDSGSLDTSLGALNVALTLAEQTARRILHEMRATRILHETQTQMQMQMQMQVQRNPQQGRNGHLAPGEDETDALSLANTLLQRLQEEHRAIANWQVH